MRRLVENRPTRQDILPFMEANLVYEKSGNAIPSKRKVAKVETDDTDIIQRSEEKRRKIETADVPDLIDDDDDNDRVKNKSPVDVEGPSANEATQRSPSPSPDSTGKYCDHQSCIYC